MMTKFSKNLILFVLMLGFAYSLQAESLYLIKTHGLQHQRQIGNNPAFKVHLFRDNWLIASLETAPKEDHQLLMQNPWSGSLSYYLVYIPRTEVLNYLSSQSGIELLYQEENSIIVGIDEYQHGQLKPYKADGLVKINARKAILNEETSLGRYQLDTPDPFVQSLLDQVVAANITASVQHLQDYGTRNAYNAQSVVAQNWIRDQFLSYGLSVELQDFAMPSGNASDNVIATLTGTKYPEEYVIVGAHYDSYTGGSLAPGADDNASGTAAVLEIARIMSQYTFDRTIVFCAFSGEEYGLYGSDAYATRAAMLGMDIHGYFNLDMIGYLKPGNTTIKSTLIYPASAQELATFYTNVAGTYLPDFVVNPGSLSGGDSDHTSFNNNGFMGIFPFEAVPDYSPYIHTTNDIVGPSYNNAAQAAVFTKASLAAATTMANRLNPPRGLAAQAGDQLVELEWAPLPDAASFNIYRNGNLLTNVTMNQYTDFQVENGTAYTYYITAIYADSNLESDPSNLVTVTPMPPLVLPFTTTFENGAPYFEFSEGWGISTSQSYSPTHSITESPTGEYQNDVVSFAYLRPFSLNLGFSSVEVSFWTKYNLETNYDYTYFEISTNGTNWVPLGQFNGVQNNWQKKTYNLSSYLNQDFVQLRFRFTSDGSVTEDGMYIDDFQLLAEGGYFTQQALFLPGWNTLSSIVIPSNSELQEVFSGISDKLIGVQTANGLYDPAHGINTIGSWDQTTGYKVKVDAACGLTIAGPTKTGRTISLTAGWNLMPVLSECNVEPQTLFAGNEEKVLLLKEVGTAGVWWPSEGLNTLGEINSSRAYWVKLTESVSITFPDCKKSFVENDKHTVDVAVVTANTHIVGISSLALEAGDPGDQILAFDSDGLLAGVLTIEGISPQVAALFGDDSLSAEKDGFADGEFIHWKLRQQNTGYYYDLIPTYAANMPDQGMYSHEGISLVESFEADLTGTKEISRRFYLYPNPANSSLFVDGLENLPETVEILNNQGLMLRKVKFDGNKLDITLLSPGIYFIQLRYGSKTITERFIKN